MRPFSESDTDVQACWPKNARRDELRAIPLLLRRGWGLSRRSRERESQPWPAGPERLFLFRLSFVITRTTEVCPRWIGTSAQLREGNLAIFGRHDVYTCIPRGGGTSGKGLLSHQRGRRLTNAGALEVRVPRHFPHTTALCYAAKKRKQGVEIERVVTRLARRWRRKGEPGLIHGYAPVWVHTSSQGQHVLVSRPPAMKERQLAALMN